MSKRDKSNEHTVSQPLSVTMKDGSTIAGTLWLHPSRRGSFEVEYDGVRKTDHRSDYTNESHIIGIAKITNSHKS
jgi:hypothetical protein